MIKKFRTRGREFMLPERNAVTMTAPAMRAYTDLLVQTCHKRGAFAMGGMAAFIPSRRDAAVNEVALAKVREDKTREAGRRVRRLLGRPPRPGAGLPGGVRRGARRPAQPARPAASRGLRAPPADLLAFAKTPGGVTEAGLRNNISVALQYLAAWLGGTGAVAIFNLMEDAATAEISRSQIWQWIHNDVILDDGPLVTKDVVERMIDEELVKIRELAGDDFDAARYGQAVALFTEVALADSFAEFLTLPGVRAHAVGAAAPRWPQRRRAVGRGARWPSHSQQSRQSRQSRRRRGDRRGGRRPGAAAALAPAMRDDLRRRQRPDRSA